jgi:hypothetical protein
MTARYVVMISELYVWKREEGEALRNSAKLPVSIRFLGKASCDQGPERHIDATVQRLMEMLWLVQHLPAVWFVCSGERVDGRCSNREDREAQQGHVDGSGVHSSWRLKRL